MHNNDSDASATDPLYAQVLGDRWNQLSPAVQQLHAGAVRYRGTFCVSRGRRWIANLLGRCLRLPSQGERVAIELEVSPVEGGERWFRRFGDEVLESSQRAGPRGVIVERFGPFELRMTLQVVSGALEYHLRGVALRLGRWPVPLPCPKTSQAGAREAPCDDGASVDVLASAQMPWFGLLVEYKGIIAPH
jgi:hypothetical protein